MGEYTCPTCNEQFDSRRGLGVHHSAVHDERLPNRECDECGAEFYADYEKKYCSSQCRDTAVSFAGQQNPNYDGGKDTTECELCGEDFEYYPSEKEGLYCPDCVKTQNWRDPPVNEDDEHPQWQGGKVTVDCEHCGESVKRYPSHLYGEVTFCSDDCFHDWLSESFTGDGHPNWEGGEVGNYGPGWNSVRREALERDDHECRLCGTSKSDLGRNPDVHHIVPVRLFEMADDHEVADAHRLDNVVSLCPSCHRNADFGTVSRERLWQTIDADGAASDLA